jgi:hypothetical protein
MVVNCLSLKSGSCSLDQKVNVAAQTLNGRHDRSSFDHSSSRFEK